MSVEQIMISVLMPVFNGDKYLAEAIDSILNQSFCDFELLILLEHGSNEESRRIIAGYTDDRIRVIENHERLGLPLSLNKGIDLARGKYIARMDSDDVSTQNRLKTQYEFLEKHPEISLCGSSIRINGKGRKMPVFESKEAIRFGLYFGNTFNHPTVMWRKDDFVKLNLYYKNIPQSEDYELWTRVVGSLVAVNLNSVLLHYRVHNRNKSALGIDELGRLDEEVRKAYWSDNGLDYDHCGMQDCDDTFARYRSEHIELYRIKCVAINSKEFKGKQRIIQRYVLNYLLIREYNVKQIIDVIKNIGLDVFLNKISDYLYLAYRVVRHKCKKIVKCVTFLLKA